MPVADLQRLLAGLYGIDVPEDVRDYVVTDAARLPATPGAAAAPEQLLIAEGGGELGLALYLDPEVLARVTALDPVERLREPHFADFCLVLEGVSHFNYVAWNAARDKAVTLLELEMQAEVDKYLAARTLADDLADGPPGGSARGCDALRAHLFDAPGFDPGLPPAALARYREANGFAGRYCRSLAARYPAGRPGPAMLRELRAFFRWTQPAKISHIRSACLS